MQIRPATSADLPRIAEIQSASPASAHWPPADYLAGKCWVAEDGTVLAYVAARQTIPEEFEILDLAVDPSARKRGIARALVLHACAELTGSGYLEVRASNTAARKLYTSCGWLPSGVRRAYYSSPEEDAVVMKTQR